mgnify:FL=1
MDLVEMLPLTIPILIFMIPIIAILTNHQRKMAELMQQRGAFQQQPNPEIAALRQEVTELKYLVQQQIIASDHLSRMVAPAPPDLPERLDQK